MERERVVLLSDGVGPRKLGLPKKIAAAVAVAVPDLYEDGLALGRPREAEAVGLCGGPRRHRRHPDALALAKGLAPRQRAHEDVGVARPQEVRVDEVRRREDLHREVPLRRVRGRRGLGAVQRRRQRHRRHRVAAREQALQQHGRRAVRLARGRLDGHRRGVNLGIGQGRDARVAAGVAGGGSIFAGDAAELLVDAGLQLFQALL
mmetsp:Transcript_16155/g.54493  ORF Transcript_16155/g.54493 Transcript_16155/m.54493 type:complete len:205 (+) Transcript_16155:101-715(+)